MKLSILIISYNEKQYLPEAIESCLKQDFDDSYEIIIGDDGSNDGSIEVIKDYVTKYPNKIQYFIMDRSDATNVIPSLRVSNVLKRGLSMATGKYIMVMSGDDLLIDQEKSKKQKDFLENNLEYSSCYTDFKKFWDDEREQIILICSKMSNSVFWSHSYVHISCFMFKQEVLKYLLNRFCDDTGMIFSIFKTGKSHHIPGVMFGYRQRDKSIMHNADKLELNILELLLFQDIKNKGGYYYSSLSRFSKPLLYVFKNREHLSCDKYKKYFNCSREYSNDYLNELKHYDSLSIINKLEILRLLIWSWFIAMLFKVICKMNFSKKFK